MKSKLFTFVLLELSKDSSARSQTKLEPRGTCSLSVLREANNRGVEGGAVTCLAVAFTLAGGVRYPQ